MHTAPLAKLEEDEEEADYSDKGDRGNLKSSSSNPWKPLHVVSGPCKTADSTPTPDGAFGVEFSVNRLAKLLLRAADKLPYDIPSVCSLDFNLYLISQSENVYPGALD